MVKFRIKYDIQLQNSWTKFLDIISFGAKDLIDDVLILPQEFAGVYAN
ncbi:MAG: hypothetical protein ABR566_16760 [Pyrinomonadaceae bacterium]